MPSTLVIRIGLPEFLFRLQSFVCECLTTSLSVLFLFILLLSGTACIQNANKGQYNPLEQVEQLSISCDSESQASPLEQSGVHGLHQAANNLNNLGHHQLNHDAHNNNNNSLSSNKNLRESRNDGKMQRSTGLRHKSRAGRRGAPSSHNSSPEVHEDSRTGMEVDQEECTRTDEDEEDVEGSDEDTGGDGDGR